MMRFDMQDLAFGRFMLYVAHLFLCTLRIAEGDIISLKNGHLLGTIFGTRLMLWKYTHLFKIVNIWFVFHCVSRYTGISWLKGKILQICFWYILHILFKNAIVLQKILLISRTMMQKSSSFLIWKNNSKILIHIPVY